jgi:hypothetical protein
VSGKVVTRLNGPGERGGEVDGRLSRRREGTEIRAEAEVRIVRERMLTDQCWGRGNRHEIRTAIRWRLG